ncbi:metal-dependent transcriptional regulator [Myroides marinus]|uniref:metal-dependent transcriptional regulator n=1 Tax=Myroides marinus TaxID=703342 RepID=UPI002575B27F|nr:metal-dependent transcriptional regulator [Myroides marinus]MDM1345681.1 metal-dependent transcriptional regulator [Myroides marinus]MDM1351181.1 metal-dependent transcriptional regulator [Myroides marinus]MDM1352916.1 metal-dependent transcriptional regulator [Myroides marinus]MDM1358388.1 metal-dependent transcriptional regulator [Myroides marinus]MDM1365597.1 metal-dependent transcriptional regulator [Myroides marinus]
MLTYSEENYLKTIFHLSLGQSQGISTNAIAAKIETKASSVTDMIKKLNDKELITYQKYQGVTLTPKGVMAAKMIVRKHRLWEVFLVEKLGFNWDEVHDVAEELEHIKSEKLINKLDSFLGYPTEDPHGDPIPNAKGEIKQIDKKLLSEIEPNKEVVCVGVKDSSTEFLQYLDKQKISLGSKLEIVEIEPFDQSYVIKVDNHNITITKKIASNLFVKKQ